MNLRVDEPPRLVDHGRKFPDRPLLGGSGLAGHEITPIESVDSVVTGGHQTAIGALIVGCGS